MNSLNHFVFAIGACLLFIPFSLINVLLAALFSLIFGVLIDCDHTLNKKSPWYHKRTWIQEPFGLVTIGLPLSFILGVIDKIFFILVLVPYATHVLLDYLCVFETFPLAPFSKIKKREGLGIFIPDGLFIKSENSKRWARRIEEKNIRGISENYFTVFNLVFLITVLFFKLNVL